VGAPFGFFLHIAMETEIFPQEQAVQKEISGIVARGGIYLRDTIKSGEKGGTEYPSSQFHFDWEKPESVASGLTRVGELLRLRTILPDTQEAVVHRVLAMESAEHHRISLAGQIESLQKKIAGKGRQAQQDAYLKDLERHLSQVERNSRDIPIVAFPGFGGTGTLDEAWALGMTGRKVTYLSYPESEMSDTSNAHTEDWDLTQYVNFYETVLKQLGIERCDGVGWSSGVPFLLRMAADKRVDFRRLALHNPGGIIEQPYLRTGLGVFSELSWVRGKTGKDLEAETHLNIPHVPPPLDEEERALIERNSKRRVGHHSMGEAKKFLQMVSKALPDDTIERIQTSMLVVASEKDRAFPPNKLKERLKKLQNSDRIDLFIPQDRGHLGIIADELIATVILPWIDRPTESS